MRRCLKRHAAISTHISSAVIDSNGSDASWPRVSFIRMMRSARSRSPNIGSILSGRGSPAVQASCAMALSEVANSWWGTAQTLPIAASQAAVTGGQPWQELIVKLTHMGAGLALIIAWSLVVFGFVMHAASTRTIDG